MLNLAQRTFNDAQTWSDTDRDVTFRPARNAKPKCLTDEQIRSYNENGYLKGIRIFDDAAIAEHRSYFDRLLERQLADGGDSYSLRRLIRFCRPVWDIVTNALILDYVEDLIGPNIVAWGTQYFCKLPGEGKVVSSHQDASYVSLTPALTDTDWLAIDDADRHKARMS